MSDIAIRVENLSKKYTIGAARKRHDTLRDLIVDGSRGLFRHARENETGLWALKDVSFNINRGEIVGIIGRNGAGKSTLLKILSRITEPTTGRAVVSGRVGSLLEVGTGFHHELTGRDNVYLNGAILGMRHHEIDKKFDEIVAFAEVEKFLDTPVKRYSSGMFVRLAFAVAAHLEPEILLVDEVLAVGDAEFQKKCLGKMGDVAKGGRTVLFVSHNMVAIEGLCSKGIVLDRGQISYSGDVKRCIDRYHNVNEQFQQIPIDRRDDRQGLGNARVTKINILDENGAMVRAISMGDNFTVELTVDGDLNSGVIGVLIGNQFKSQLIRGYTWENLSENVVLKNRNIIRCHFYDFPLLQGVYNIHTWIAEREGNQNRLEDYVENAALLEVKPKDIYGNGRLLDSTRCLAFCKIGWDISAGIEKLSK